MSIKITKKNLKELAESLNAVYCGGNVYTHENIEHYITSMSYVDILKQAPNNEDVIRLANQINDYVKENEHIEDYYDKYRISSNLIAYSAGDYGNTGQIFQYEVFTLGKSITFFYTYYC